jgi:hypothetical protein
MENFMYQYVKKIMALMVTITLLSSNIVNATEETSKYEAYADKLSSIDVFKGSSNGYELDRAPTRLEGLVMHFLA